MNFPVFIMQKKISRKFFTSHNMTVISEKTGHNRIKEKDVI